MASVVGCEVKAQVMVAPSNFSLIMFAQVATSAGTSAKTTLANEKTNKIINGMINLRISLIPLLQLLSDK